METPLLESLVVGMPIGIGHAAAVYPASYRDIHFALKCARDDNPNAVHLVERGHELSHTFGGDMIVEPLFDGPIAPGMVGYELLRGRSFHDYINTRIDNVPRFRAARRNTADLLEYTQQSLDTMYAITKCLSHLKHKGLIAHCDIKPENILIPSNHAGQFLFSQAKLLDFDGACVKEGEFYACTNFYGAPELAIGQPNDRSDLYSIGKTLLAALIEPPQYRDVGKFEFYDLPSTKKAFQRIDPNHELSSLIMRLILDDPSSRMNHEQLLNKLQRISL